MVRGALILLVFSSISIAGVCEECGSMNGVTRVVVIEKGNEEDERGVCEEKRSNQCI